MENIDVEKQLVLLYDPSRCTGCLHCQIACSYHHFKEFNLEWAHIRIEFDEETGGFEAIHCQHCDEPLCMAACPKGAIGKDEKTGLVRINPLRCIGCRACIAACPISAPWFNPEHHVAMSCDFCDGDPRCAKFCSPQAIRVASREEALEQNIRRYLEA